MIPEITEEMLDFARAYRYAIPQELIRDLKIRFWLDSDTAWFIWELTR